MMWHDTWGVGDWLITGLLMLVFWALAVGAVVWAVGAWRSRSDRPASPARTVLDERFARGEITTDEYVERRDLLSTR